MTKPLTLPVPGYPELTACRAGHVYRNGIALSAKPNGKGYLRVNHKGRRLRVHRLVCSAFHGLPANPEYHCRHRNHDNQDNRPVNLLWGTDLDNKADSGKLVLTADAVTAARSMHAAGLSAKVVAEVFGVKYNTMKDALSGRTWKTT